jgi:hypothetical protein
MKFDWSQTSQFKIYKWFLLKIKIMTHYCHYKLELVKSQWYKDYLSSKFGSRISISIFEKQKIIYRY